MTLSLRGAGCGMAPNLLWSRAVAGMDSALGRYRVVCMTIIKTRVVVAPDGTTSGRMPMDQLQLGGHEAVVTVATTTVRPPIGKPFTMVGFPTHDIPWDGRISFRREDTYDDEGKLA